MCEKVDKTAIFAYTKEESEKSEERKEYLLQGTQRGRAVGWKPYRELDREVRPGADSVKGCGHIAGYVSTRYVAEGKKCCSRMIGSRYL